MVTCFEPSQQVFAHHGLGTRNCCYCPGLYCLYLGSDLSSPKYQNLSRQGSLPAFPYHLPGTNQRGARTTSTTLRCMYLSEMEKENSFPAARRHMGSHFKTSSKNRALNRTQGLHSCRNPSTRLIHSWEQEAGPHPMPAYRPQSGNRSRNASAFRWVPSHFGSPGN